jgi:hypothetical protein
MVLRRWVAQGRFVVAFALDDHRMKRSFVEVGEWFIPSPSAVTDVTF